MAFYEQFAFVYSMYIKLKVKQKCIIEISGSEQFLMRLLQFPFPIVKYFWKKKSKCVYSVLYKVENWGILCELCVSLDISMTW